MVTTFITLPPSINSDEKYQSLHNKAVKYAREAQDIYKVPAYEIKRAAITALVREYFFEELPKILDEMAINIKSEIVKNVPFKTETYGSSRILYDSLKPFFDKVGEIIIPTDITDEKELRLYKSVVNFLYAIKKYIEYLDEKLADLDKPKFNSRFFSHLSESELWAMRNKKRPYLI